MTVKKFFTWVLEIIVFLGLIYTFAFPYSVTGKSMEPEFKSGDKVIVSHFLAWIGRVSKGEVVVCDFKDSTAIKRVIAGPGDRFKLQNNQIFVNDEWIDERYIPSKTFSGNDIAEITLGEDEYYLMGDNRAVSKDSRQNGPVKKSDIKGKVIFQIVS